MDYAHIVGRMIIIFGVVMVGYFAAKRELWAAAVSYTHLTLPTKA